MKHFVSIPFHWLSALCLVAGFQIAAPSTFCADPTARAATAENPQVKEIEAGIAERRAQVIAWSSSAVISNQLKLTPYDYLAATARDGCGPPERAQYMTDLGKMGLTDTTQPIAFEMFSLPPLVRYLYMFGNCMSDAQKASLLKGLSETRRGLFAHGTLNHMIMQSSSWYLLAQYFPGATWTDMDGTQYKSSEVMARTKELMARRNWRFFQTGSQELLSPTYSLTNLFPTLNLIDFAKDPEVARRANDEASLEVILLKAHSFHGVIMPPLTRRNVDQTNAPLPEDWPDFPSCGQHVLWYYFGEPRTGKFDLVKPIREPYYPIMFALSSWRPPLAAWSMPAADYVVRYVTPDFSKWDDRTRPISYGDTYIGRNYALATGNMIFDPTGYNDHNETFAVAWRSDARRNLLECQQPYWRSNEGENAWTTDFWSPFVQTYRLDKQRTVLIASIPQKDPWTVSVENRFWTERDKHKDALFQEVQCRVPRAVDQLVVDRQWAFFRSGNTYIALASLKGPFQEEKEELPARISADFIVLKVHEAKTALFVMVNDAGGSFASFCIRARAAMPRYDDDSSTVTSVDAAGKPVRVRFVTPAPDPANPRYWRSLPEVSIDGVVQAYRDSPVYETPFINLADGVLQITGPNAIRLAPEKP